MTRVGKHVFVIKEGLDAARGRQLPGRGSMLTLDITEDIIEAEEPQLEHLRPHFPSQNY